MTLDREELRDGWTVSMAADGAPAAAPAAARAAIAATVPGQVHTDLLREGVIDDPAYDRNEDASAWVGRADWVYRRAVDVDPRGHERVDLVCEGLDTVASLSLDGVDLGSTRNMHRRYRFDLRDSTGGSNARSTRDLEILFESPYREAARLAARAGTMPGPYDEPFAYVRKMASDFGWDWGLTAVTSGPWRPVAIERWSTARLRDVRPLVDVDAGEGVLDAHIGFERSGMNDLDQDGEDDDLVLVVTVSGHGTKQRSRVNVTPKDDEAVVTVRVPEVERWWPRGYGEQPLYDVDVVLQTVDGDVLDRSSFRTGFRSTRIDVAPDEIGRPFSVHVNRTRIDVRGVNWIPDDVIVSRVTRAALEERLGAAVECNANLVRVWGGGVYESHDFYETCDELGLLVWQDFAFACSAYPETKPIRTEVIAEARDNVARLSRHPSLVVWNGNNENIWLHDVMGWDESLQGRGWGLDYYLDLLPTIVDAVDPSRFYTVASPWSGSESLPANDVDHETHHSWDVWNRLSDEHYRDSVPRFGSGPFDFDQWHYLTQLQQTRAIATGVEHWRTHWPRNTGVIVWQLNDLWAVSSWSAIDGAGRRKPLAHELRRLYDDVLVAIRPVAGAPGGASSASSAPGAASSSATGAASAAHVDDVAGDRPGGSSTGTASLPVPQGAGSGAVAGSDAEALGDVADTAVLDLPGNATAAPSPIEVAVRSSRTGLDTTVRVRRIDLAGAILAEEVLPVHLDEAGVAVVPLPASVGVVEDPTGELVVADVDWHRSVWTPAPDVEMRWEPAHYRVAFSPAEDGDGQHLVVEATSLVRDLLLQPDRVSSSGSVDRGFMTLLPGERVEYRVRGVDEEQVEALLQGPAMWTIDRVVGAAQLVEENRN